MDNGLSANPNIAAELEKAFRAGFSLARIRTENQDLPKLIFGDGARAFVATLLFVKKGSAVYKLRKT
jgi:hypothetical protein